VINQLSNYFVILVATYNRLALLKKAIDSIEEQTHCSHEIIVIDGGSTDGTIEYLRSNPGVTPVFQGELIGTARAYNQVWRQVKSKYTCWLSDDTEVVGGSLDQAIGILESQPQIGLVGLKMKDTEGPWVKVPYLGGFSKYGVLNCNHGVLPMNLLRAVNYFNENYRAYMIDPDLTASVLCSGRHVVMTKHIGLFHHREWATSSDWQDKIRRDEDGIDNKKIYLDRFKFLEEVNAPSINFKTWLDRRLGRSVYFLCKPDSIWLGQNRRDWRNLIQGRFIRFTDPIENIGRPFHLVQRLPRHLLLSEANPVVVTKLDR